ncbi:hypothetical protein LMH66_01930 [Shewanella sp. 10N.7]|uniref:hypothetical protein n=1 Tax=Shewanella sp. 10N.7 TaxID=2885093 RepID=UPI001E612965|nr:hypothetical protein [Shewanella sp. 10N.7]MCC4831390.1 hypothetical protein [Shewanella sp. 10N.7]
MESKPSKVTNEPLFHTPKAIKVSEAWLWPTRIILIGIALYFAYSCYSAFLNGEIYGDGDYYYREEEPFGFWCIFIAHCVIVVGTTWQSFKVSIKT